MHFRDQQCRSKLRHPPLVTVPEAIKLGLLLSLRHAVEPARTDTRAAEHAADELAVCPSVHLVVGLLAVPYGRRTDEGTLVGGDVVHRMYGAVLLETGSAAGGAAGMISVQDLVGHIVLCLVSDEESREPVQFNFLRTTLMEPSTSKTLRQLWRRGTG